MKKESLNAAFLLIWWVEMWALESPQSAVSGRQESQQQKGKKLELTCADKSIFASPSKIGNFKKHV